MGHGYAAIVMRVGNWFHKYKQKMKMKVDIFGVQVSCIMQTNF